MCVREILTSYTIHNNHLLSVTGVNNVFESVKDITQRGGDIAH